MELGIDSLKGWSSATPCRAFNHSFSATLMIDHPTVEALARLIREGVLGVVPIRAAPAPAFAVPARVPPLLAADIAALGDAELDALLRKSIDDVLSRGGQS